ncbi:MAG: hypothetical protein E7173_03575 [Firmicutes bacterium]|nr:hypothetical protein [Bacillota bacterium]
MSKTKQIAKKKVEAKKNVIDDKVASNNEIVKLIKIVLILCAVLLLFYFLTEFVNQKLNQNEYSENTTPTIQYSKILVGQILNRDEKEYYVLVEAKNDQYLDLYNYYLSSAKEDGLTYYTVDLSDVFNGNHLGDETDVDGDVSQFKFADTTLLRIKKGKVYKVYSDREAIVDYLEKLK